MVRRTRQRGARRSPTKSRAAVPKPQAGSTVRMGTPPDRPGAGLPKTPKGPPSGRASTAGMSRPGGAKPTGGWAAEVPPGTDGRVTEKAEPVSVSLPAQHPTVCARPKPRATDLRRPTCGLIETARSHRQAVPPRGGTQPKTWKRTKAQGSIGRPVLTARPRRGATRLPESDPGLTPGRSRRERTARRPRGGDRHGGADGSRPERLTCERTPRSRGLGRHGPAGVDESAGGDPRMPRRLPAGAPSPSPRTPGASNKFGPAPGRRPRGNGRWAGGAERREPRDARGPVVAGARKGRTT